MQQLLPPRFAGRAAVRRLRRTACSVHRLRDLRCLLQHRTYAMTLQAAISLPSCRRATSFLAPTETHLGMVLCRTTAIHYAFHAVSPLPIPLSLCRAAG